METITESTFSTLSHALSPPVSPTQSQHTDVQSDVQPNVSTPYDPLVCRICEKVFSRVQDRDRHIESYLPHSIHCPSQGCCWTGRRQPDFKFHWGRKHSSTAQVPRKAKTEIYNPREFVKSIVDGANVAEVARSAFATVQKRLGVLQKVNAMKNVLGRTKDSELRKWIRSLPSASHLGY